MCFCTESILLWVTVISLAISIFKRTKWGDKYKEEIAQAEAITEEVLRVVHKSKRIKLETLEERAKDKKVKEAIKQAKEKLKDG